VTLRDAMMLAVSSLRGSFTRTLLTVLGLGVGVGAVLTVLTLGSAGETRVEQEIARLGVDKVWITAADEKHVLTPDCAARVAEETGAAACAGAYTMGFASLGDHSAAVQIAGYDTGMAAVHAPEAAEGRLFTRQDHQERRSVCIVDEALAQSLGGNVLHRRITAGGRRFLVVGVMDGMPMQAMAKKMDAMKKDYEAKISEFSTQLKALNDELDSAKQESISIKVELENTKKELSDMTSAFEEKKNALASLHANVNTPMEQTNWKALKGKEFFDWYKKNH